MNAGMTYRLGRVFGPDGRAMVLPVDHGLMLGRVTGLEEPASLVAAAAEAGCDGLLMSAGLARATAGIFATRQAPARLVTLDTTLRDDDDPGEATLVASVAQAVRLGADTVKILMPWDTPSAARTATCRRIAVVIRAAERWQMPVMVEPIALSTPRSESAVTTELHGARTAMELGAHIIKIAYPGSAQIMASLTRELGLPVMILGGPKSSAAADVIRLVDDAMTAGAAGIVIGRQVWQREPAERLALMRVLVDVVHGRLTTDAAVRQVAFVA
jgi:class I fructose-bisphosphate aldolase